jgi:small subunit ribosomal protein S20
MKRDVKSKRENAANKAQKSTLKTMLKKFDAAVAEGDKEAAAGSYKVAVKSVDRAAARGLIHKNNAARKKSALTVKLSAME